MPSVGVYLVRHEDAEDADASTPDAHRALTGRGRRRMRATGKLVIEQEGRIDCIYTSPLVRAVQTAEILAAAVGLDEPVIVRPEIASPPTIRTLFRLIDEAPAWVRGLAIVGHEPTISAFARALLGGNGAPGSMQKGTVLKLEYAREPKLAQFRWLIVPDGPNPTRLDALV